MTLFSIVWLIFLPGCPEKHQEVYPCPTENYLPTGYEVEQDSDCPDDRCVFICDHTVCDGPSNTAWCESCEDVLEFVEGPCAECRESGPGHPVYWPSCA